ncbi:MAG: tRNA-dihydrouridine synthase, partial [Eubacteriales bacterium]|nr:tRNA-dihydrouridine synthase [Eubacteriales bacterium]
MKLYFAPIEGIAGYIYRNAHRKYFGGADTYFSPFLAPTQDHGFTTKEKMDVLPEHNQTLKLVPQILTNQPEAFLWAAEEMQKRGYQEVNLNLGCPSGTVVSKRKGAGFLGAPAELDRFLDAVFSKVGISVSVKTRLGMEEAAEFEQLL